MSGNAKNGIERSLWVDNAKGIGIILVVYGHAIFGLININLYHDASIPKMTFSIIYTFHMPLFFFLAGLYFEESYRKRGAAFLIANKIDRIIYPYIIWSLIQYTTQVLFSGYTNWKFSYDHIPFLLLKSGAQFWFLHTLFFVFLVCILVRKYLSLKYFWLVFLVFVGMYTNQDQLPDWLTSVHFYNSMVFFMLGVGFSFVAWESFVKSRLFLLTLGLVFLLGQYIYHAMLGLSSMHVGIEALIIAVPSIFFICSLSMQLKPGDCSWLELLGKHSMAIYLMNILGTAGTRIFLNNILDVRDPAIHLTAGFIVGLIGPILFYSFAMKFGAAWLFEPSSKWSVENLAKRRFQDHQSC